jgi:hypothetical protein
MSYVPVAQSDEGDEAGEKTVHVQSYFKSLSAFFLKLCVFALILGLVYILLYLSDVPLRDTLQQNLCTTPHIYTTTFEPDLTYQTISHSNDEAWNAMFPHNGGFRYQAPANHGHEKTKFGIGMFHELHCVWTLRERIQSLTARLELLSNVTDPSVSPYAIDEPVDSVHVLHCLDYLRQVGLS